MTMTRFPRAEVDAAITSTDAGDYGAQAQVVLAAEVEALRLQYRTVLRCPDHGIVMYAAPDRDALECWHCNEGGRLRSLVEATGHEVSILQQQVQLERGHAEHARSELQEVRARLHRLMAALDQAHECLSFGDGVGMVEALASVKEGGSEDGHR